MPSTSKLAEEAVCIGPAPRRLSYLNMPAIISAAEVTDAEAIHPGYGFLSENADLPSGWKKSGFTVHRPDARVDPHHGRQGLGQAGHDQGGRALRAGIGRRTARRPVQRRIAKAVGYPRSSSRRRAAAAGVACAWCTPRRAGQRRADDQGRSGCRVWQPGGLHGEVPPEPAPHRDPDLADKHRNAVYLGERDCSMQRRHQKVIEEAPAPGHPAAAHRSHWRPLRSCLQEDRLPGAGTFEFLYENGEFYFIEMNTRVQVEHPVTEWITGCGHRAQTQIMVAAGESCPFTQRQIEIRATRSSAGSTPRTLQVHPSPGASRCGMRRAVPVRVDSHAYTNYFVPPNYDSMIGKLIVHGDTREQTLAACAPPGPRP